MQTDKLTYAGLFLSVTIFGSMYIASKIALAAIPALLLLCLRFGIGSMVLLVFLRRSDVPKVHRQDWPMIFLVGFAGYFVSNGALLLGIQYANASTASLINALNPIFIILFARVLLREALTLKKIASVLVAVCGAGVIIGSKAFDRGSDELIGIAISVFSMVSWSFVIICIRKVTQKYPPILITAYGMLIATICAIPTAVLSVRFSPAPISLRLPVLGCVLYVGLVCTGAAHLLWNHCLSKAEANICAIFYPIQPMVSAFLGWLILDETISLTFILGGLLILGGVLLNLLPIRTRVAAQAKK